MRRAAPLALALLVAASALPLTGTPAPVRAAAGPAAPSAAFPALPEDAASARAPLDPAGRWIVVLRAGSDVDRARGRAERLGVKPDRTYRNAVRGYAARLDARQVATLRDDPDVAAVVPDELITTAGQVIPKGISRVNATISRPARIDGRDQRVDADVAIVDTGIDKAHEDLNVAGGISCATSDPRAWGDPNGHGTHVAGTVGALDNGRGVVGVAPGVRLWAVRILDPAGNGLLSWYVCGLDWITAQRDPVDPSRPLFEAVNMSVAKRGGDDGNCGLTRGDVVHQAICRLVGSGVTVVAAAGNNAFDAANLIPASYDEVITVSALADTDGRPGGLGGRLCYSWGTYDRDDTFADFSNFGRDVDLIAPGKCTWSTLPGNRYGYSSGTSMAAPHVAGAAALYRASRPAATPEQVKAALVALGSRNWARWTDPDGYPEPLLDVSNLLAAGDFVLDATPGTAAAPLVPAAGAAFSRPVTLLRSEEAGPIELAAVAPGPVTATLDPGQLAPAASVVDSARATLLVTVPPGTPTGTYPVSVTASDGTRQRTSVLDVTVDADLPRVAPPDLTPVTEARLDRSSFAVRAAWAAGTDVGTGVAGYQVQWRVDGGAWTPRVSLGAGTRQALRTLVAGHDYVVRVRARDRAGNWSAWAESPSTRGWVWQEQSATLRRTGTWRTFSSWKMSGGTSLFARARGASVTRTFTGRGVAVVAPRGPSRGRAQIWVDGTLAVTVDLYRATSAPRRVVFARSWARTGTHSVRIVVLGTSGRPRVDVDAFVILR